MKQKTLSLSVTTLLLVILFAPSVFAETDMRAQEDAQVNIQSQSRIQLPDAGLKPGDILYFVDRATEEIQRFFVRGPESRLRLSMQLSEERLAEAVALSERGETNRIEQAAESYTKELNYSYNILAQAGDNFSSETRLDLQGDLAGRITHHLLVLDGIVLEVPETAYKLELAQALMVRKQVGLFSAIADVDMAREQDLYTDALDVSVERIQAKANNMTSESNLSVMDNAIRDFDIYIQHSQKLEADGRTEGAVVNTNSGAIDTVAGILGKTITKDGTGVNTYASQAPLVPKGCRVMNPNIYGTVTRETGAPVCDGNSGTSGNNNPNTKTGTQNSPSSANNSGDPAFQSNNGGISWQEYIRSR